MNVATEDHLDLTAALLPAYFFFLDPSRPRAREKKKKRIKERDGRLIEEAGDLQRRSHNDSIIKNCFLVCRVFHPEENEEVGETATAKLYAPRTFKIEISFLFSWPRCSY